jgi:plastocyanin
MRSRGTVAALTVAGLLLAAPVALADEQIVGATPNRYENSNVTIDQGERLTFRNTDFAMHDVTSETSGLFASETIGQGATSFVEGSQYLTTGSYNFFCSIHAQMRGTITVTSAGTPAQRPGTGGAPPPGPDTTAPVLSLKPRSAKARTLARGGELKVDIGTDEGSKLTLTVKLGSLRAARVTESFTTAGTKRVAFKLSKKARKKLRRGSKLKLSLTGTDTAGNSATKTGSLKLR